MARLIRVEASGPIKLEPAQFPRDEQGNLKPIFICACGLTSRPPFCDGTHKVACKAEVQGQVYESDPQTKAVTNSRPE
jgi:CDGSH-type Zn-finger protein